MSEDRPTKLPTAWPHDGRSKMKNTVHGWVLTHPDRGTVVWKDDKWQMHLQEQAA